MDAPPPDPSYLAEPDSAPAYIPGALLGGLLGGAISMCCCWCSPIFGALAGVLAAVVASRPAFLFGPTEGAIAGAAAGAVAGVAHAGITIPLTFVVHQMFKSNPQLLQGQPPVLQEAMRQQIAMGLGPVIIQVAITAVILFVSCVIGGAIGGVMRRKDGDKALA